MSHWAVRQRPTLAMSHGCVVDTVCTADCSSFERYAVLVAFTGAILASLGGLFVVKEWCVFRKPYSASHRAASSVRCNRSRWMQCDVMPTYRRI